MFLKRYFFIGIFVATGAGMWVTHPFSINKGGFDADGGVDKPILPPAPSTFKYRIEQPQILSSTYPNIDCNTSGNNIAQGETGVAINPTNPNIVISGANDYRSANSQPPTQWAYYSTNGGLTWTNEQMPPCSPDYNEVTDPSLTYDASGVAYFGFGQFNSNETASAVTVQRSLDGGITWQNPVIVYSSTNNTFEDKYYIAADANSGGKYEDNVYISWTHFTNQNSSSEIYFAHSTNQGLSWSQPVTISPSGAIVQFSMPTVGPNGEVYVFYSEFPPGTSITNIYCAVSTNGGQSFSSPNLVSTVNTMPNTLVNKDNLRMITYSAGAVDASQKNHGRVYVTWAALNSNGGQPHIYLSYSDSKGASWSTPQIVDGDLVTLTDKFHPWIACDPVSGTVAVSYYDSRNDPQNVNVDLYVSYSTDGATTFSPKRITNENFAITTVGASGGTQGTGGYWADYTGIAAYKGKIIPSWTDQRSGSSIYNTDAYISIMSLGPNGVTNLAASIVPNSPATLVLNWVNPTSTVTGDPLTSYKILIYQDSQLVATLNQGGTTYTANNLQTGTYYTYQVYIASGGDTSNVENTAGYAGGEMQPEPANLLNASANDQGTQLQWQNPATHLDGTPLYDMNRAYIYIDGSLVDSIVLASSDSNQITTYTANTNYLSQLRLKHFHSFGVTIVGEREGILTRSVLSDTLIWWAGSPNISLSEGFEESSPVFGTNGTWTVTSVGGHTGTNSLTDNGNLLSVKRQNTYAMMPPTIIQAGQTQFSFWQIALIAQTDSGVVEFTTNNGKGGTPSTPPSWHAVGDYNRSSGTFTYPLTPGEWQHITYDMTTYVGDTVVFRFRLKTSSLTQSQGWFIDDIALQSPSAVVEAPLMPATNLAITNYPNPFSTSTVLSISGVSSTGLSSTGISDEKQSPLSLRVYNIAGDMVADLSGQISRSSASSNEEAIFDAVALPAGSYFAILRQGQTFARRELTVVK